VSGSLKQFSLPPPGIRRFGHGPMIQNGLPQDAPQAPSGVCGAFFGESTGPPPDFLATVLADNYVHTGYIYDIYDGDTVYYHASPGYHLLATFQIGRLFRVQTPEIRPLKTREAGLAAKEFL